ncbi:MAG TPA: hypothetical protein VM123_20560 [archaeon]|nr:hypothetical protein [archaeon]
MKKLLAVLAAISVIFILYFACETDDPKLSSSPELAAAEKEVATLSVSIKTNGGPVRKFKLQAIEWDGVQDIQPDKFYEMSAEKRNSFQEKLETQRGKKATGVKTKVSVNRDSPELAGWDSAPGLFAYASAECFTSSCHGSCQTTASQYYYNTKTHEHEFCSPGKYRYYSHEDEFSEWSEIDTQYDNDDPRLTCESILVRDDYYYAWWDTISVWRIRLAAMPGGDDDEKDNPPSPPYDWEDIVIQKWIKIPGDAVNASDNCGN